MTLKIFSKLKISPISRTNGFSIVEMLVSMIVAAILILTIGVLSSIANSSYHSISKESEIYNDITYGFKLMQNKVRSSNNQIILDSASAPWVSQQLRMGSDKFGIYLNGSKQEFSYDNGTAREVIFAVPSNQVLNLTFPFVSTDSATVQISGTKDNIPFDMSTTILRRAE